MILKSWLGKDEHVSFEDTKMKTLNDNFHFEFLHESMKKKKKLIKEHELYVKVNRENFN